MLKCSPNGWLVLKSPIISLESTLDAPSDLLPLGYETP